jgi:hypothetical protein
LFAAEARILHHRANGFQPFSDVDVALGKVGQYVLDPAKRRTQGLKLHFGFGVVSVIPVRAGTRVRRIRRKVALDECKDAGVSPVPRRAVTNYRVTEVTLAQIIALTRARGKLCRLVPPSGSCDSALGEGTKVV